MEAVVFLPFYYLDAAGMMRAAPAITARGEQLHLRLKCQPNEPFTVSPLLKLWERSLIVPTAVLRAM